MAKAKPDPFLLEQLRFYESVTIDSKNPRLAVSAYGIGFAGPIPIPLHNALLIASNKV